jgi:DNA-binding MarR family transcriptional regulator
MKSKPLSTAPVLRQNQAEFNVVFIHSTLDDLGLSPARFRVYCHLARRANTGTAGEGGAWPAVSEMARVCRLHPQTVRKALRWLAEHQLLTRQRRPGRTAVYRLTAASRWKRTTTAKEGNPASVSEYTPTNPMGDHSDEKDIDEGNPSEGDPRKDTHTPSAAASPSSLSEVEAFASLHGISPVGARAFYHETEASGWVNRHGQPIRNWQAALMAYGEKWRTVEHRQATRTPSRPRPRGPAFANLSAATFTSTQI